MVETWIDRQEAEEDTLKPRMAFDAMTFPKRFWQDDKATRYKVYSSNNEFVIVAADTAALAAQNSGIEAPVRIERYILSYILEVDDKQLTDAIDVYVRPLLDTLTQESPVISNKILTGLIDAAKETRQVKTTVHAKPDLAQPKTVDGDFLEDGRIKKSSVSPGTYVPQVTRPKPPEMEEDTVEPVMQTQTVARNSEVLDDVLKAPSLKDILGQDKEPVPR